MVNVRSYFLLLMLVLLPAFSLAAAEQPDTTGLYRDRTDSLSEALTISATGGNFISRRSDLRTEVISASGLCKMACCNLAESFENSASVTVGYSDAVTGARRPVRPWECISPFAGASSPRLPHPKRRRFLRSL